MNRRLTTALLLTLIFFFSARAQTDSATTPAHSGPRPKVGIFIPLYLDSVFTPSGTYRYSTNIPKYVLSGLEFYSGVRLALDSLQDAGAGVEVFVIDTKDRTRTLQQAIDEEVPNAALLIGMVSGKESVGELRTLAEAAHKHNVPFISATYPNDGGITGNPSLVIVNSTLKSHTLAVYKYLQRSYYDNNIVVFRKPGTQEDKMKAALNEANQKTGGLPLKMQVVDLPDDATIDDITPYLDSTRKNAIYCATLDIDFGTNLLRRLSNLKDQYTTTVFGMPTWDGLPLNKSDFKGIEVIYTTPFVTASGANPRLVTSLANKFKARSRSRASDMVYRGYEITLRYISNLLSHIDQIVDLSDIDGKVFSDFDIQPIKLRPQNDQPDYYENRKIYFIKKVDGIVKGVY